LLEPLESRVVLSLAPAVGYGVGALPQAIATGDFNGDTYADVITANKSSGDVSVLMGNGNGTLGPAMSFEADAGAHAVAVGDFDQDPAEGLDAVTANAASLSLITGKGDGTLKPAVNSPYFENPRSVAVGDLDNDGDLDLVATRTYSYLDPSFKIPNTEVYLVVFRNDLDPISHTASFSPAPPRYLYTYSYGSSSDAATSLQLAEINGQLSVVFANPRLNSVSVMLGNGAGGLAGPYSFGTGTEPRSVMVGDFNGDERADLAVANQGTSDISIFLATGTAQLFQAAGRIAAGPGPTSVTSGDVNGDGHSDLATANADSGNVSLLLGYGDGSFGAPQPIAAGSSPGSVVAVDLNADGRTDLVVTNPSSNQISMLLSNSDWVTPIMRPTATLTGPAIGLINQSLSFTLGASGEGLAADTVFSFAIDWNGDGTTDETLSGPSGTTVSHVFPAGNHTVGLTATDPNFNPSLPATHSVTVLPVNISVQPDPVDPALSALVIEGSPDGEAISVSGTADESMLFVTVNGHDVFKGAAPGGVPFGHIFVNAGGGNDLVELTGGLSVPALVDGGDGGDGLDASASAAGAILIGGAGNDRIVGSKARDLLIGGQDHDTLSGGGDDDILIGGSTDHDQHAAALLAIMAEWEQADVSYATRVAHLVGGGKGKNAGGGLNVPYLLNSSTVHDDGASDELEGGPGTDWFLVKTKGVTAKDTILDKVRGETATQI
jgi:hypothetical protein